MNAQISTFKEFFDEKEAAGAVRALQAAGFEEVETFDLSPHLQEIDDVGPPDQKRKKWAYLITGPVLGVMGGALLGSVLFFVPSAILQMPFATQITVVGVSVCMLVGLAIGLQEAWILAKRACYEPTSSNGARSVGVKVRSRDSSRLKDAKTILAQFGEKPRWLEMRMIELS